MSKVLKTIKTIVVGGRELKCQSCGNEFTCGVSLKGCWCSEVEVLEADERRILRVRVRKAPEEDASEMDQKESQKAQTS